jgi:membrane protein YqaA with SNARE-associated domain
MASFSIGRLLRKNTRLNIYIQNKFQKYVPYINKWGGVFIVIAAITPLPFSPVCLLGGTLNYPLKKYAMYAATRLIRFAIYGFIFMKVLI